MLDQQKEREAKNEDEENDQASIGKLVTSLLDQKEEQEVKYEDGGNDQASTEKPSTIDSGILDCSNSGLAAVRS